MRETFTSPSAAGFRNTVGTFMPLYQMRSKKDWGICDFVTMRTAVDFHKATGQGVIQISPFNLSSANNSPYSVASSRLIDPIYINIEAFLEEESTDGSIKSFMSQHETEIDALKAGDSVDYSAVRELKMEALKLVWDDIQKKKDLKLYVEFMQYIAENKDQIEDHILYSCLKEDYVRKELGNTHWTKLRMWDWRNWEQGVRDRDPRAISNIKEQYTREILFGFFVQFVADKQFERLKQYGAQKGVQFMIDIPFALDGADIWIQPDVFGLKKEFGYRRLTTQGVPPEPAYPGGQYWQFYPYDWANPKTVQFVLDLFAFNQKKASYIRLDHVLGYYRAYLFTEDINGIMLLENMGLYRNILDLKEEAIAVGTEQAKRETARRAVVLVKNRLFVLRNNLPVVYQSTLPNDAISLAFKADGELLPDSMITIARQVSESQYGTKLPETSRWKRQYVVEKAVHKGQFYWDFIRITPNTSAQDEGFMYDYMFDENSEIQPEDSIRLGYFNPAPGERVMSEFLRLAQEKGTTLIWETLGIVPQEIQTSVERLGGMNYIPAIWGEEPFWGKVKNPYYPEHHIENAFVTYGLHDSTTIKNRWERELSGEIKEKLLNKWFSAGAWSQEDLLSLTPSVHRKLLEMVYYSKARIAVLNWIDLLGLGEDYRINTPGVQEHQWEKRLPKDVNLEDLLSTAVGDTEHSTDRAVEVVKLIRDLIARGNRQSPAIEPDKIKLCAVTPEIGAEVVQFRSLHDKPFLIDAYIQGNPKNVFLAIYDETGNEISRLPMQKAVNNNRHSVEHGFLESVSKWTGQWVPRNVDRYIFRVHIGDISFISQPGELVAVESNADLNPISQKYRLNSLRATQRNL